MAHFAHVDPVTNIVDQVTVIERDVLEQSNGWLVNGVRRPFSEWVQTSYRASKGAYKGEDKNAGSIEDIKARNRLNFAGVGYEYHRADDMFVPPKPFASWTLDKVKGLYVAPKPKPVAARGETVAWDEAKGDWVITKKVITL